MGSPPSNNPLKLLSSPSPDRSENGGVFPSPPASPSSWLITNFNKYTQICRCVFKIAGMRLHQIRHWGLRRFPQSFHHVFVFDVQIDVFDLRMGSFPMWNASGSVASSLNTGNNSSLNKRCFTQVPVYCRITRSILQVLQYFLPF